MLAGVATRWRQVPRAEPVPARRWTQGGRWLLAVAVAMAAPLSRSLWLPDWLSRPERVALVLGGASVLTGLAGEKRWWIRLPVAAAAGWLLLDAEGELIAAMGVVGVVLGDWAVRRWSPLPGVPRAGAGSVAPAVVLSAVAAHQAWEAEPGLFPLVLLTVAVAITALGALSAGRLDSALGAFGVKVGDAVGRSTFALAAVPLVVLPWLGHRLARVDPLNPEPSGGGWSGRRPGFVQAERLWAVAPIAAPAVPWGRRLGGSLAVTALVVPFVAGAVWAGSAAFTALDRATTEITLVRPAAYADADWYEEYKEDVNWITSPKVAWYPLRSLRIADVRTRHINVSGGVRRSWTPPECDCRRVSVWMYGGSTTFGLGQRDEHTIASELSRLAWEDGIAVDIHNRGSLGDLHWGEAQRFAWDLSEGAAPDVVLFYDGVNELWSALGMSNEGVGDVVEPYEPFREGMWVELRADDPARVPPRPDGAELLPAGPGVPEGGLDAEGVARLAASRYDRSRGMSRDSAARHDVRIHWFWQPSRFSRPANPEEDLEGPEEFGHWDRESHVATEAAIPIGVHDVTDALEGTTAPFFTDDVHHNEAAARLIAEAMYPFVRDDLAAVAGGAPAGDRR